MNFLAGIYIFIAIFIKFFYTENKQGGIKTWNYLVIGRIFPKKIEVF